MKHFQGSNAADRGVKLGAASLAYPEWHVENYLRTFKLVQSTLKFSAKVLALSSEVLDTVKDGPFQAPSTSGTGTGVVERRGGAGEAEGASEEAGRPSARTPPLRILRGGVFRKHTFKASGSRRAT